MSNSAKVPPDGGYGWVIVFAQALSNIVIIPLMQSFGLIFNDTFIALGLSATQGSLIINFNSAFSMLTGIVNGVLLKIFGYRKIAVIGSVLLTGGIIMTSFARTFAHFVIAYGLVTSLGMGMSMSAYSLAINTYFKEKRGKAVGLSMTVTGLGPILMPQVINILMQIHTVQGVTLILGAISANTMVSAFLLQPIKWHLKPAPGGDEELEGEPEAVDVDKEEKRALSRLRTVSEAGDPDDLENDNVGSIWSIDHETAAIYGVDSTLGGSILSLHTLGTPSRKVSLMSAHNFKTSSNNLNMTKQSQKSLEKIYNTDLSKPIKKKTFWQRIGRTLFKFFDLDLLKDPIYVNIMIGMSLAIFAELNFSVLTAFILADFGLSTSESATFMSVLGVADIIFRFFAPYIGDYLNKPARPMYGLTLFMLIITRFTLLLTNDYGLLLGVAAGLGIAKGVRTVYMNLVIPSYVPIEKLASASGIQMMMNGLFILIGGPILGVVRDKTGSYAACIVIMNCITFTTILMWTIESIIVKLNKPNQVPNDTNLSEQHDILLKK